MHFALCLHASQVTRAFHLGDWQPRGFHLGSGVRVCVAACLLRAVRDPMQTIIMSLLHSDPQRLETCDDVMSSYKDRVGYSRGRGGAGPAAPRWEISEIQSQNP